MNINVSKAAAEAGGPANHAGSFGFKVDLSRGERVSRVSSEWFSRPEDERFLSLPDLYAAVRARSERATARTVESRAIRVEARRDDAERLALIVPGRESPVLPTHWSSHGRRLVDRLAASHLQCWSVYRSEPAP